VPDKGLDRVFVFRFDSAAGRLSPHDPPHVTTRAGAGPRHLAFHPRLPVAYLINEIDSTLTTYAWDAGRGTLEALQILPTLPASFTGDSIASEIVAAPCGRFVYGSNRGHDSIAVFAVDQASGLLSAVGWDSTQGSMPRFFTLDPSARLLYVANQESDTVVAFQVDAPRAG
jgi:6-phosphogluconolactonase